MKRYLIILGLFASLSANAALLKSYDFNGDFTDTLSNGNDLTASGGTINGGRYNFGENQGLELTSALANTSAYGIEIKMKVTDNLSGYGKIIDFHELGGDGGLYFVDSELVFVLEGNTVGSLTLNTDFTVGLERSSNGVLQLFLNGSTPVWTSSGDAIFAFDSTPSSNVLNFFVDDNYTSQGQSFAGSVDFIRIHDDSSTFGLDPNSPNAVPVPAALFMFAPALLGFLGFRRKVRR